MRVKSRLSLIAFLMAYLVASIPALGSTKAKKGGGDLDLTGIVRPSLLNAQNDPTLRFPVMRTGGTIFSLTYGWLDISSRTIRYTVVQPTNKGSQGFEDSKFAVSDIRFGHEWLEFKAAKKGEMLTYLPQDRWGTVHSGPGMNSAANRESLGTASIYKTMLNFDAVLALVKPPAPPPAPVIAQPIAAPPAKPAAPPSPPAIVLSAPAGAGNNQTLEIQESTVVIRGVAMDSRGIPVVRINGSPANMRPQTTQAAEFWSDPMPLQAGNNPIQVVASNSAQVQTTLDLTVHYQPKAAPVNPRALGRAEIISLLQGAVPCSRIADLVKERGIKFSPKDDDFNAIRAAGGTDELIETVRQASAPQ